MTRLAPSSCLTKDVKIYPTTKTLSSSPEKESQCAFMDFLWLIGAFAQDRGRNKWRCPVCSLVQYRDEKCPYTDICQRKKSEYGRVFYTYPKKNYRFFTPVPRGSELWSKLYEKRSACERSFKRKKQDYKLSITRTRGGRIGPFG